MIVLGVALEHAVHECDLPGRAADQVEQVLAVVPDLVVFLVAQGDGVEPLYLCTEGVGEGGEDAGAVEPFAVNRGVVLG